MAELSENRKRAIRILERVAEVYGDENIFDSVHGTNKIVIDGKETLNYPDGKWFDYEDAVTSILDEEIPNKGKTELRKKIQKFLKEQDDYLNKVGLGCEYDTDTVEGYAFCLLSLASDYLY